jgi:predicted RNA binding protein YcfA (HicA-like mRNA interferase family)
MPSKVRDILKQLNDDGWTLVTTRGRVTVHGKPSDDIAPGTLNSILKQAGLTK